MIRLLSYLALVLLALPVRAEQVTVFAAASLKTALDEVAASFEADQGHRVVVSYAGSSVLARQIEQGAPADIVIMASPDWMDYLSDRALIAEGTRRDLFGNCLVLIVPKGRTAPDPSLAGWIAQSDRIAMALVNAVPAGIYGKAALTQAGLWEGAAPKVVQTDNVRAALRLVAVGAVPVGVVYASDALAEPRVRVVARFAETSHPPIRYPAAIVAGREQAGAQVFLSYLEGQMPVFARHGFLPLTEEQK